MGAVVPDPGTVTPSPELATPGARWLDRARAVRDRWLADARFRQLAADFPLTRPIARRHARLLFDLCAGFVYSQVLAACVQLRLFDLLAEGPQDAHALAERMALAPDAAARLLAAAASLRLVARRGTDHYALGPLGAAMAGNTALAAMIEHHALLYADLRDPVALLRGAGAGHALAAFWPYAETDRPASIGADQVAAYTSLMAASQPLIADEVLAAYPLYRHRCLLDVGGGDGAFVSAAAARFPALKVMLFDLPAVADRARTRFAQAGLGQRAMAFGGDFLAGGLPTGADVVSLVRVAHDHDDAGLGTLLQAIRRALPADGTLLLAEPMADTRGAEPMGDAYFGFYLLAMGRGRPRSRKELIRMLRQAGFRRVESVATRVPLLTGLIVARP